MQTSNCHTNHHEISYHNNKSQVSEGLRMSRIYTVLFSILFLTVSSLLTSCDTSADRELHRAEEALNAADAIDAEAHAPEDYMKAEELFEEAMSANEKGLVQETRRLAIQAKLRAEDAADKTKDRQRALEAEQDRLGR